MDVKKFSFYTTAGSLPWCFALAYVGFLFGPHWEDLGGLFVYLDVAHSRNHSVYRIRRVSPRANHQGRERVA